MNKIKCGWCGKEFKKNKRHQKYCSNECSNEARRDYQHKRYLIWYKKHRNYYKCQWCKKEFIKTKKHRKYCSDECAKRARAKYQYKRFVKWREQNRDYYNEYMRQYMQEYRKSYKRKEHERLFLKAGTIYLKKTEDWNEELKLLEKFLKPIRHYR